jgi:DNA-binding CsgD family transcriptional regulator
MTEVERKSASAPSVHQIKRQTAPISLPGLLLLGPKRELIACNAEAVNILIFPSKPGKPRDLRALVASKFPINLFTASADEPKTIAFMSGKRRYRCTAHPLEVRGHHPVTTAFLLHRAPSPEVMLCGISVRYNLTVREREAMGHLIRGLTSKEIGQQMKISPNTVKAFLRLVMTKMGVTTRAGVVGRMAGVDFEPEYVPGEKH